MTPEELLAKYELTPSGENTLLEYERQLWQARYSPSGQFLIACGYDATIQRWDMSGKEPQLLKPLVAHNGWVQDMAFHPQEERLLTADSWGRLTCWSYSEPEPAIVWALPEAHDGWIRAVAVSPDGKTVATGGNGSLVKLWSADDGQLLGELPHPQRVYSLCFHPNGESLATGDLEGIVRDWNVQQSMEVRQLAARVLYNDEAETKGRIQQCGGVRHLDFDADGKRLVCGGQKEPGGGFATGTPCVIVFDWASGEQIREMPMGGAQDGFSYDARFHPDGFVMATSSAFPGKGHVWFWRPEDDKAFFSSNRLPNGRSISLHPDGTQVAHLTSDARNANGRPLADGVYAGGTAKIQILKFPVADSGA